MLKDRLIEQRKRKDLTQQELADILNISRGTYGQYEIGRRSPEYDTLIKLADFFGCTTDYLLGRTDHPSGAKTPAKSQDDDIDLDNIRIAAHDEGSEPITEEEEFKLKKIIRKVLKEVREERQKEEEKKRIK